MKRKFIVAFLLAIVTGTFHMADAEQESNYFVIKVNKANILAEPNTNSKIVGSAHMGSYVRGRGVFSNTFDPLKINIKKV